LVLARRNGFKSESRFCEYGSPDREGRVKVLNTFGATLSPSPEPALRRLTHQHRHHRILAQLQQIPNAIRGMSAPAIVALDADHGDHAAIEMHRQQQAAHQLPGM